MKILTSILSVALLSISLLGTANAADTKTSDLAKMQKASTLGPHLITFDGRRP